MPSLKLKAGTRARALNGHPWVFASEVQKLLSTDLDGRVVECRDAQGYLLGSGLYNSRSQIIWRRFSIEKSPLDKSELEKLILQAIAKRKKDSSVKRLIWSESDSLPGLVVDQYEKHLVIQMLTLGMDKRTDEIIEILIHHLQPLSIIARNDVPSRTLEGLEQHVCVLHGQVPEDFVIDINGVSFAIDLIKGQKTGFYLDQKEQHLAVSRLAAGKRILDAFCNQGGFALHATRANAKKVVGIDISEDAIQSARTNAERNHIKNVVFSATNVFDYFRHNKDNWDLIILDPPSFVKNKAKIEDALRGYKEINLRAIQRLTSGGLLATYCCSHHITKSMFQEIVAEAAWDAHRQVRIVEWCSQPPDHPVILNMPESEYLHGLIIQVD